MFISHLAQGFFTTVQYDPDAQDLSLAAKAEAAADMCRSPGHWQRRWGVRITHDLILRPANGLCLGKSLAFLSASLSGQGPSFSNNLIKST